MLLVALVSRHEQLGEQPTVAHVDPVRDVVRSSSLSAKLDDDRIVSCASSACDGDVTRNFAFSGLTFVSLATSMWFELDVELVFALGDEPSELELEFESVA